VPIATQTSNNTGVANKVYKVSTNTYTVARERFLNRGGEGQKI